MLETFRVVAAKEVCIGLLMIGSVSLVAQQPRDTSSPPARWVRPELNPNLFKIDVQLDRTGYRAGEPILLKIAFRNISTRELIVLRSDPYEDYKVEVFQDNGRPAPMTRLGGNLRPNKNRRTFAHGYNRVKPLQELHAEIDITELFDLHKPGAYTVVVSRETDEMVDRYDVAWFRAVSEPKKFFISQ